MSIIVRGQTQWAHGSIVTAGLTGAYDAMEYTTGSSVWTDLSSNGANLVVTASLTQAISSPTSLYFTGSSNFTYSYFTGPANSILTSSLGSFSVTLWAKSPSDNNINFIASIGPRLSDLAKVLFTQATPSTRLAITAQLATGFPGSYTYTTIYDPNTAAFNTWYHIGLTLENGPTAPWRLILYVNGQYAIQQTSASRRYLAFPAGSGGLTSFNTNPRTIGSMQTYNRGLSAAEVLQNYNAQKFRFYQ